LALPLLTSLAAAIGNTRRLELKAAVRPPIIWCLSSARVVLQKHRAFKLDMRPIREQQRKALECHAER